VHPPSFRGRFVHGNQDITVFEAQHVEDITGTNVDDLKAISASGLVAESGRIG
jgi:hypothetical protein